MNNGRVTIGLWQRPSDFGLTIRLRICIRPYTWQKSKLTKWATQMLKTVHEYSFIITLTSRHWQIKYFSHLKHQLVFVIKVLSQATIKRDNTKWVNSKYIHAELYMLERIGTYCRWLRCKKKLSYKNYIGYNRQISEIVCNVSVLAHLIMLAHLKLYM